MTDFINWFAGGEHPYHRLYVCMSRDVLWVTITVLLDLAVASGYVIIAYNWWSNQKQLEPSNPAHQALKSLRNIFIFCGICGYLFIPIKMFWPAWRLYDMFMVVLVYSTWKYAWKAGNLKIVYSELGKSRQLAMDLERTREEARRKSFFLNSISHDLRTPLNGLMLQAEVAQMSLTTNDPSLLRESISEIKATAQAAADLLSSFLDLGRIDWAREEMHLVDCDLMEIMLAVVGQFRADAEAKGLRLVLPDPKARSVRTDRIKLERILSNLLNNAVKFTDRGSIEISTESTEGGGAMIHISDTGLGISPEHLPHVFDEFFQVQNTARDRNKGFGLGLAIARRLARQLGGDITAESHPGRGSRFTVTLSAPAPATESLNAGAAPAFTTTPPSASPIPG